MYVHSTHSSLSYYSNTMYILLWLNSWFHIRGTHCVDRKRSSNSHIYVSVAIVIMKWCEVGISRKDCESGTMKFSKSWGLPYSKAFLCLYACTNHLGGGGGIKPLSVGANFPPCSPPSRPQTNHACLQSPDSPVTLQPGSGIKVNVCMVDVSSLRSIPSLSLLATPLVYLYLMLG